VRIAGLDVGERRIGIAISDPTKTLARPFETLRVGGLGVASIDELVEVLTGLMSDDDGLELVVVGLPRRLDGTPNELTAKVELFAHVLERRIGLPVVLQDERLTSREAESRLAEQDKDWRSRKAKLDAAAAAIILQDYLDSRPAASAGEHIH
jgi:putative Holliday junction resolvase